MIVNDITEGGESACFPLTGCRRLRAKALYLGERIDLRTVAPPRRLSSFPLTAALDEQGVAVLFRYGAVVLFNATPQEEQRFLQDLAPSVNQPFARPEVESVELCVRPVGDEGVAEGVVVLRHCSLERLQVAAVVLSRTVVLAEYEARIAESFDRIEPLAMGLERTGREGRDARQLLRNIGHMLLMEHKIVGRLEVQEKPELMWERPDLEPLYQRLTHEYELRERHQALERKIQLVSDTVRTMLELLQNRRTLRVEWYIVLLIVLEIVLGLYDRIAAWLWFSS
ncbi:MAG: RMD1 family protein [Pirellulaceae bacterium]